MKLDSYTILEHTTIIEALMKIDANKQGFVVVVDDNNTVLGVLTDGDVRRAIINGAVSDQIITDVYTSKAKTVCLTDEMEKITDLFKDESIKFAPIVDSSNKLVNILTKKQIHTLLLQDIHADLSYDFSSLDTSVLDHEIFFRPWGYYKTTVLNDYFQAKIISVKPGGQLSLQSHDKREEYWIVVHGNGTVQLDNSVMEVSCGSSIFIPKGCRHRLVNTDSNESLIISEVQIGDYFGEDDITRYEDIYGRV